MGNYKVTIIVPIYKSEEFVEQCVNSLLNQNFDNIEYIFINDNTPDKSFELVKRIVSNSNKKNSIILLENNTNLGVSETRKIGMKVASGEYVIQIDSDDWCENNMILELYNEAITKKADIVCCDFFINKKNTQQYIKQKLSSDNLDCFKQIILGDIHGSLSNKLIKRELYTKNNIYPSKNFNVFEDKWVTLRLFLKANKISYLPRAFLHYRKHNYSLTTSYISEKYINDSISFIEELKKYFIQEDIYEKYKKEFYTCILYHKKVFLLDKRFFYLWDQFYPEANKIKYVLYNRSYSFLKKMVVILTLLISKNIMYIIYNLYKIKK